MARKIRWGVLSTAEIGRTKVIPAMQRGRLTEVSAIASRDLGRAQGVASQLGIPRAYGSYQELLADPALEAIYLAVPNHLHVEWSVRAIEAGKHVLCEKPLSTSVAEIRKVVAARDRVGVKVGEAFMVHTHPQWVKARALVHTPEFGRLRAIHGFFSYNFTDPTNIRNILEYGGGGLRDVGGYPIHTARLVTGQEPTRVVATMEADPVMKIDRLDTVLLEFPDVQAAFTCSTQLVPYQRMQLFGTGQRVEVEIPFNAPIDRPCRILVDSNDLSGVPPQVIELPTCDQYTIQADAFSEAILSGGEVPVTLENAIANQAVVDAIFRSAKTGTWSAVSGG
jgi:predicted dehydrogenase